MSFLSHEIRPHSRDLGSIIYNLGHKGLSPTGTEIASQPEPKPVVNEVLEEKDGVDLK